MLSDCCNASLHDESDVCSKCGEHCVPIPESLEEAKQIKNAAIQELEETKERENEL